MKRGAWGSRAGFIFAVTGSAVGLANIWRLPYIVGENGGAAFLIIYLLCLMFIGFPVLMSEIIIGRSTPTSPSGAFLKLSGSKYWSWIGKMTIMTGFIVSAFYSAVAGWIFGYLIEAFRGNLSHFQTPADAELHFNNLMHSPLWGLGFHCCFLLICFFILILGVRGGIERGNKIMMPCLILVLVFLVIKGLTLPNAILGIKYLLEPDFSEITPKAFMVVLGQSFFTLSLGQGTMITYGSYLSQKDNLIKSCLPVVAMDTIVSLLAAFAVFAIVFSGGMKPDSGPGLIFNTLPLVFSQMTGGYFLAIMFFLLVLLAAITSEISAMEPVIAYLIDEKKWTRKKACLFTAGGVFLLGIPSAWSMSVFEGFTIFGYSFIDFMSFLASSILIPLGGFFAVILVGWVWGVNNTLNHLKLGASKFFQKNPWASSYFWFCFKYSAPILIIIVFLNAIGLFNL